MNLYVIAGFLGSGKTSLLLSIAKAFSEKGKKLAIIENEVGKVGVDDVMLKEEGLPVKEIYSGCICCSLRLDLIHTLMELERRFEPDVVLLEPSGVASPKQVISALEGYGGEIENRHVGVVIDAERFGRLHDLSLPIITDGINTADLLIINKTDLVDPAQLDALKTRICDVRSDASFHPVSALTGENLDSLVNVFLSVPMADKAADPPANNDADPGKGPTPVPYSEEFEIALNGNADLGTWRDSLCENIQGIAQQLEARGCSMIGHIKAVIKSDQGGYLVVSTTTAAQQPHTKGKLPKSATNLSITLNIIIYGLDHDTIADVVNENLRPLGVLRD